MLFFGVDNVCKTARHELRLLLLVSLAHLCGLWSVIRPANAAVALVRQTHYSDRHGSLFCLLSELFSRQATETGFLATRIFAEAVASRGVPGQRGACRLDVPVPGAPARSLTVPRLPPGRRRGRRPCRRTPVPASQGSTSSSPSTPPSLAPRTPPPPCPPRSSSSRQQGRRQAPQPGGVRRRGDARCSSTLSFRRMRPGARRAACAGCTRIRRGTQHARRRPGTRIFNAARQPAGRLVCLRRLMTTATTTPGRRRCGARRPPGGRAAAPRGLGRRHSSLLSMSLQTHHPYHDLQRTASKRLAPRAPHNCVSV